MRLRNLNSKQHRGSDWACRSGSKVPQRALIPEQPQGASGAKARDDDAVNDYTARINEFSQLCCSALVCSWPLAAAPSVRLRVRYRRQNGSVAAMCNNIQLYQILKQSPLPLEGFGEALGKQSAGDGNIVLGKRHGSLAAKHHQQHQDAIARCHAGVDAV